MKQRILIGILACGVVCAGLADDPVYTFDFDSGFVNGTVVPDGNVTGWSDTRTLSDVPGTISDVNVFLALSGGYNGDLYGYLAHSSGFAVLLNRSGSVPGAPWGYDDAGMDIRFDDTAANGDIHFYQLVGGYQTSLFDGSSWAPDGRFVNPATTDGTEPRTSLLADFIGLSANGEWTLFLADLSVGEQTTVVSWGLEITVIPEPSAGAILGLGLLTLAALRRRCLRGQ